MGVRWKSDIPAVTGEAGSTPEGSSDNENDTTNTALAAGIALIL